MSSFDEHINYSAFQYNESVSPIVDEICIPLFSNFGIKTFRYGRFFNDGRTYFLLSSHKDWFKHCLQYNHDNGEILQKAVRQTLIGEYNYFLWPYINTDPILSGFYQYGIWHGLSIYKRHQDFVEFWCFAVGKENELISNFYLNHKDILKYFTLYFNEKASSIINISDSKYLVHWKNIVNMQVLENGFSKQKMNEFFHQIEIEKFPIRTKEGQIYLSKRESECVRQLILGKATKEIAHTMNLSPRTIEFYINNIKKKTGFRKKIELTNAIITSDSNCIKEYKIRDL